jgi:CRP/FNR family transcriptional regulator, cyclic AMP receptor protein
MTLEPTSCALVSGADLRAFIAAHPDFAHHLILKLITRLRSLTGRVKSLALEDVYGRVVALLQATSAPDGEQRRIVTQKMTEQDIAEHVGSSREMVSRIFKQLTVGGYVDLEGGHIRLLKTPPALWSR